MFRQTENYFLMAALLGLVASLSYAQPPSSPRPDRSPDDVIPSDETKQRQAFNEISQNRRETIAALLHIVREETKPDKNGLAQFNQGGRLYHAIEALGHLRADEAVETLLDNINIPFNRVGGLGRRYEDPVIKALTSIGKPASAKALAHLSADKSEVRRTLYLAVIYNVEGEHLAREMIRASIEREKDPSKQARLMAALELLNKPAP